MVNFVIVFSQQQQKTGKTLKLLSLCYAASLLMGSRVIFQTQKMGFDRAVKTQEVSHPKKPLEKKKTNGENHYLHKKYYIYFLFC